ncbi:hypothetical protein [Tenacibaculum finnmarkense]|uniref:hypothetical protein n=1 Tax=Tenacibaculum finnmarkense TaxID=2781243 RepID=UPI00187B74A6|nr:hypothetical protein [Tenacibaculum finnmarkense]MBE7649254.1 hypothetical protein [Tenacibaculum finnmarkense genomovar ulcerans]
MNEKNYKKIVKNSGFFDEETIDNSIDIIDAVQEIADLETENMKVEFSKLNNSNMDDLFSGFIPVNRNLFLS